jgi:hypothetical protein
MRMVNPVSSGDQGRIPGGRKFDGRGAPDLNVSLEGVQL